MVPPNGQPRDMRGHQPDKSDGSGEADDRGSEEGGDEHMDGAGPFHPYPEARRHLIPLADGVEIPGPEEEVWCTDRKDAPQDPCF